MNAERTRREDDGQTFPRWANHLGWIGLLAGTAAIAYATVLVVLFFSPSTTAVGYAPLQPVPYSHALHVGDLGLDCRYCHDTVEFGARAAIPPAATCMNCHASIAAESEALEPIRAAFFEEDAVRWKRVHDLPDFVYFDHSAHLRGGIGCVSCHGRVDRMDVVRQAEPLTMGWCLDCHREPERFVQPRATLTQLAWTRPADAPDLGERLVGEYHLAPSADCSVCHR